MSYLLDTNVCIHFLNHRSDGAHAAVVEKFRASGPDLLAVSTMTLAELHYGAEGSKRVEENRQRLEIFAREIRVLPFDATCAARFGRLKSKLKESGKKIPDFDVAIAATALATGRILASQDRHMRFIDGLEIEDWTAG